MGSDMAGLAGQKVTDPAEGAEIEGLAAYQTR